MREKRCPHCGLIRPTDAFGWNGVANTWNSWCRHCTNRSKGHRCEICGAAVSNVGGDRALAAGRQPRCISHRRRPTPRPAAHGTLTRYRRGCRCRPCTDISTATRREFRARTGK